MHPFRELSGYDRVNIMSQTFDVVGVGLNATDTVLLVPHLPGYGGKAAFQKEIFSREGR